MRFRRLPQGHRAIIEREPEPNEDGEHLWNVSVLTPDLIQRSVRENHDEDMTENEILQYAVNLGASCIASTTTKKLGETALKDWAARKLT